MTNIQAASSLKPSFYKTSPTASNDSPSTAGSLFAQLLEEGRDVTASQAGLIKNEVAPEPVIWDTTQWLNTFEIVNASIKAGTQAVKELLQVPL